MRTLIILSMLLANMIAFPSYAQNINGNEVTLYADYIDGSKKSYCVILDSNANIRILETTNGTCGGKSIDYKVQVSVQKISSQNSSTNKLLKKETFLDPFFISRLSTQVLYITSQYLSGNFKPEKAN